MVDLKEYRASPAEEERTADLMALLPRGNSILDVGARDGHFSRIFAQHFPTVFALDLERPAWEHPGVSTMAGDVMDLREFPDSSVDVVFCAEVLEHIPALKQACREIARVARHHVLVGVPYKQDTRVGRTTCQKCGGINPPWGHINEFDEPKLISLFAKLRLERKSFVGSNNAATTPLAMRLMDFAGNPWGTYRQDEPCACGAKLEEPKHRTIVQKVASRLALFLQERATFGTEPHANWIHALFSKA